MWPFWTNFVERSKMLQKRLLHGLFMLMTRFVATSHAIFSTLKSGFVQRKLNVPVTATLLRSGLISIAQQDQQLAKFLFADAKSTLQNFAAGLIRECLTCDPPLASQSQFSFTIEVLSQIMQSGKANEE